MKDANPRLPKGIKRVGHEFARNLAVTFSLPFIDLARWSGADGPARPLPPASGKDGVMEMRGGRAREDADLLLDEVKRVAKSRRPIIVGPWLSEVGFELLYWIPFIQWVVKTYKIDPARISVVSRGGVAGWYSNIGGRYVEMLDRLSPEEFFSLNQERIAESGFQKHMKLGPADRKFLERVGFPDFEQDYEIIHPSTMYQLLVPLWKREASARLAHQYAVYKPLPPQPEVEAGIALPERFTSAKFYFSTAFPQNERNLDRIRHLLELYLKRGPVVLLSSPARLDDHEDILEGLPDGLTVLNASDPAKNLAWQSQIIARSERFVGTYGGFSYLAPLMGVPSLCIYSEIGRVVPVHMDVAFRVFRNLLCGSLDKAPRAGVIGVSPSARFTPIHVDSLDDLP